MDVSLTPDQVLESIKLTANNRVKVPSNIRELVLPKSPTEKHQLHKTGTFSCQQIDAKKLKNGEYQYLLYYDGFTRTAYVFDALIFKDISYVEYEIKGRTRTNWVGYVKHAVKTNKYLGVRHL